MRKLGVDFESLMSGAADLREHRAKLENERGRIADQVRAIQSLPPDKAELKAIMRRVIAGYQAVWNGPLIQRIEHLKNGFPVDEFVSRHIGLAGCDDFISDNGWTALLGYAMTQYVDAFVDTLDWPDGIAAVDREARLGKLQIEIEAVSAQIAGIDAQFEAIGLSPYVHQVPA